ncbi:MAG: hypothetical protein WC662_02410 [Candidatus Paceibacterota bacterium]|jgi:cyanophycin synthetase
MKHCKDCEPAQEIHWIAYTSVVLGWIANPFFDFMEMIFKNTAEKVSKAVAIPFFKTMIFLKLGHFDHEPDKKDTWRTKCFWEEAKKRGIKMHQFKMGPVRDIFVAEYNGKTINFDCLPRPETKESDAIDWMDNKGIMKRKFLKVDLPVAKGGVAWNRWQAIKIFNSISKPVITKPNLGSRSRHTMIHINTKDDLIFGFKKAQKLSPLVVVEEELNGHLFRGTLIDEKLVGVIQRDQPQIKGDGIHSIRELWEEENKRPERSGPIFHKIVIDHEVEVELNKQGLNMESITPAGKIIYFSQKTSRSCGGTTTEVTEIIHPENIKMLEKIGAYLKDPLVGVDFIMEDITKPWTEEQHCGIIECNSCPFIDLHHYPLFGKPNNVAGKLWDLVMPESKIE